VLVCLQLEVLRALVSGLDLRTSRFLVAKRFVLCPVAQEQLSFSDAKSLFRGIMMEQSQRIVRRSFKAFRP
jgi:hypothetical protein